MHHSPLLTLPPTIACALNLLTPQGKPTRALRKPTARYVRAIWDEHAMSCRRLPTGCTVPIEILSRGISWSHIASVRQLEDGPEKWGLLVSRRRSSWGTSTGSCVGLFCGLLFYLVSTVSHEILRSPDSPE